MKTLLIVAHAPSKNTQALADAAVKGASQDELMLNVVCLAPEQTGADDILQADGIIIGTTENLGYMAGLTKDMFDRCYYDVLDHKHGLPVALYVRAGHDGTGTRRAIESIVTGLRWQWVQDPMICQGPWQNQFTDEVAALSGAFAAGLDAGIY